MRAVPLIAMVLLTACANGGGPAGEVIFIGGTVASGPSQAPQKNQAIVARDGAIVDLGPASEVRRRHRNARLVDASSGTILPGLTDAHAHLYGLGQFLDAVDLVGADSAADAAMRAAERARSATAGEWILGRGWDQNRWPGRQFPTAAELDGLLADRPVWLKRIDGHAGWANTAAMRAAGVTSRTVDPEGGRIIRDPHGNPTGIFVDRATALIESRIPPPSFDVRKRRINAAARRIVENGLTEIHDPGADAETVRAVRELIAEGRFPMRVYMMLTDNGPLLDDWFARGPLVEERHRLTIRAVKLYADGALGSRGAALLAAYSDDPGNTGLLVTPHEHMVDVARRAIRAGFQVATHAIGDRGVRTAIGDRGVRTAIDAYEAAGVAPGNRFRIEHLQVVAPDDLPRLPKDGLIASMQPTHATSDMPWAESRLGPERIKGAYAWRTVLNEGIPLAFGSDAPVESVNPFYGIHAAVTRQDHHGNPAGGWYPDQRLTLAEAVRAFTIGAAFAAFEERSRGTIEVGKIGDFTIVDGDLYAMQNLFTARVRFTIVGGEIVYAAPAGAAKP